MPQPRLSTLSTIVAVVVSAEIRSIPAQSGWIQAAPPVSMTPRGFTGPTSDFLRNRTVVFGGWSGATVLGDTWEWDGATWSQATPVNSPPPRCCSYVAYDYGRARVVLFGGAVGTGASTDVNDTWEWDGTNWTSVTPLNSPQARRGGTLVYDPINAAVLLFGGGVGSSGSPILSDTWTFDGVTWTQQTPSNVPPARWQGMVATDWSNGTVVMFGGAAGAVVNSMGDTWLWDGSDWYQQNPATQPTATRYAGGTYDWQLGAVVMYGGALPTVGETWVWTGTDWHLDPRAPSPAGRPPFALGYDNVRNRVVLAGGGLTTYPGDTWEWNGAGISSWSTGGSGCAGATSTPTLAPAPGSLPILGGTFDLDLEYAGSNLLGVFLLGLSDQVWAGGTLPQDLGAYGMPGCDLRVALDATAFAQMSNGLARLTLALPANPGLIGTLIHAQGFVSDPGVNPAGALVSNSGRLITGVY